MTTNRLDAAIHTLIATLDADKVSYQTVAAAEFAHDFAESTDAGAECVVFAETVADVQALLAWAEEYRIPVYPAGARTGLSGGSIAFAGGVALSLTRMNRILELDVVDQYAIVEPGVITQDLQDAATAQGLLYPPDPASAETCTIGGNIATNAGGVSAVKYGVTGDYVMGLEGVLAGGQVIRTGAKTRKSVVGYDLTRLLVGSEGTLGIITKAILRLAPQPERTGAVWATFASVNAAVEAAVAVLTANLVPRALEIMDAVSLTIVRDVLPLPLESGVKAALLIECDGHENQVDELMWHLNQTLRTHGPISIAIDVDAATREGLWSARRAVLQRLCAQFAVIVTEDVTVPRSRLNELIRFINSLVIQAGLQVAIFGHIGDGNMHVSLLADDTAREPEMIQAMETILRTGVALDGTISGEHGIGLAKSAYLSLELTDAEVAAMWVLKQAWDPHNILNPTKIFGDQRGI